ncbi:MAG: ABC transporter permease, partial [Gemmatimonas sp.]
VMVRSLPVEHPEELVTIPDKSYGSSLNYPLWEAIRDANIGFKSATVFSTTNFNLSNGGEVRRARGSWVSGEYFTTLGVKAAAGRLITISDDTRGCAATAVLGYGFWQSEYGGSASAIGKTISLSGNTFQIIGVAADGFFGAEVGRNTQVYAPFCANESIASGTLDNLQHMWFLSFVGRLAPGTTIAQVETRLSAVMPGVLARGLAADEYSNAMKNLKDYQITFSEGVGELSNLRRAYSKALYVLMTVVAIVLLIGCANVANLLLARAAVREREIAVRLALGASRSRVMRQLLTETMLLTAIGAIAGIFFAKWSNSLLLQLLSSGGNPIGLDVPIDGRVMLFTIGVATITGLLFGVAPAWRTTRTNPQEAMRANARGVVSGQNRISAGKMLVVSQVALSLILVVGAGLLLGTFNRLHTMNPGFVSEGVLLVNTNLQKAGYAPEQSSVVVDDILQRLRTIPGVASVSASDLTPVSGSAWNTIIQVDGYNAQSKKDQMVFLNQVSADFFATMKTRVTAGRVFGAQDRPGSPTVAIINQTMAAKFFAGANAVGKHFRMPQPRQKLEEGTLIEVVGVVEDAKYSNLKEAPRSVAYLAMSQKTDGSNSVNYELRTSGDPRTVIPAVTSMMSAVNPRITVDYRKLEDQVAASLTRERLLATLSAFFGALALLLAMIGLYGTLSYGVSRRRNEIGIRLALGAERANVLRMVLGEVARLLAVGVAVGLAGAVATSKYVASFLFGVEPNDITTLVMSAAVLACVALAAGALPAWRASRLDPMLALRED